VGTRSRAERDAVTVETGYALVSAVLAAALVFGAVVGPALVFELPGTVERSLVFTGVGFAALVFVARVVHVLWRFPRPPSQPSHPGRTSPDS
jgi:hypothetical protein